MKRLLLIIVLGMMGFSALAENKLTKTGYVGNVSVTLSAQGPGCDILTSHGYSFGNGLWMGGGTGVSVSDYYRGIYLPIFAETKYSFTPERKVSPFVDCKLGYMVRELNRIYAFASPAVGVDIDRWSVFASYNTCSDIKTVHLGCTFNF